jgi:hypothetical protein
MKMMTKEKQDKHTYMSVVEAVRDAQFRLGQVRFTIQELKNFLADFDFRAAIESSEDAPKETKEMFINFLDAILKAGGLDD